MDGMYVHYNNNEFNNDCTLLKLITWKNVYMWLKYKCKKYTHSVIQCTVNIINLWFHGLLLVIIDEFYFCKNI